jgi:isopenicillin N synthase-like dioxygenase
VKDGIEQFNWYSREWQDHDYVPDCIRPFMDEIQAFSEVSILPYHTARYKSDWQYLTNSVNRRLLTLFSRVLELDDDYLWTHVQSHVEGSATGEGYFRHAIFRPVEKETQEAAKGLKMHGHTDFGLTTLLFSVPISCLQIWKDDQWFYVPYKPGCLVVNIGETLEIVSGGHFKATRHRVFKPPADQAHEERLSIVQFNSSVGDMRMTPAASTSPFRIHYPRSSARELTSGSPLIQREGCVDSQGVYAEFKRLMDQGVPVSSKNHIRIEKS